MKKPTIASVCREMIIAGKTDNQLERKLRRIFGMSLDRAHYNVSWYRSEVRRKKA